MAIAVVKLLKLAHPIIVFDPLPANCPHGRPIGGSGGLRTSKCCMFVRHPNGPGWVSPEDRARIIERIEREGPEWTN